MNSILQKLTKLIESNATYIIDGSLNRNLLAADARKYDSALLNLLLKDRDIKKHFFSDTEAGLVFKKDIFLQFISNKEFLPDSYTKYKIKIGLGAEDSSLLSENRNVVLNWPYKDAILEGGQEKEDQKRGEVFFNEILAPDQITRLLDNKIFTNWKRYDKNGQQNLNDLKDDDNLIVKGNNLIVLHSLKKRYAGKVKLIYIDPPYNTGSDSFGYNDRFNHSTWLTFMKNRLQVARELLREDGIIVVQCDDNEQAYLRVLLDEKDLFDGRLVNVIALPMSNLSGQKIEHAIKGRKFPKIKEYLLVYSKSSNYKLKIPKIKKEEWDSEYNLIISDFSEDDYDNLIVAQADNDYDTCVEILKNKKLISLNQQMKNENIKPDDDEWKLKNAYRIVATKPNTSLRKLALDQKFTDQLEAIEGKRGGIKFIRTDFNRETPTARIELAFALNYLATFMGDIWPQVVTTGGVAQEGGVVLKNGKKPEALIRDIISFATDEGDLVLDYHLGSGTTAAVAHKMKRQYIGIEQLYYGNNDPTVRLKNVVDGDQTGISKSVEWNGGGSFVYCNIMNNANKYREHIEQVKSEGDYIKLLKEATGSSFLSYRVDPKKLNEDEFRRLSSAEKRRLLLELIDNNTLYVNYEDINDPIFKVSDKDKEFNKKFYEEK